MRVEDTFYRKPVPKPPIPRRKKTNKFFSELLREENDVLTRNHSESDSNPADHDSIDLTA